MKFSRIIVAASVVASLHIASAQDCTGEFHVLNYGRTSQHAFLLSDGSLATRFGAAVNVDGTNHAYHKDDVPGGGIIALCNGGTPHPAGRPSYNASANNKACGQFRKDYAAIRQAGWKDPQVGAIHWFGVLGKDSVRVGDQIVTSVVPIEQTDGSGFFVSSTALEDPSFGREDQRRYVDAEKIPAAVIRESKAMRLLGIRMGTFGVAIHQKYRKPVPFIVGDYGPRIGEGTFALGRLLKGLELVPVTRKNVWSADIKDNEVLWVFFGGHVLPPPYTQERVTAEALRAFEAWGGTQRPNVCLDQSQIPLAQ